MLELKNLYKTYSSKNGVTHRALENVSLKFNETGLVFILGKSGSGKSTLLNLIGGVDSFDRGDILFNNQSFLDFKESDYDHYRNSCVGFVFQDFNLIDNLTVFENVALALDLQSKKDNDKVNEMLSKVEAYNLKNRMINELSGGQRQRVSIARALIKNPRIILADEPTGALDSETSDSIIKILTELSKDRLVIIVTHNKELAYEYGDRIIEIRDGFVLKDLMRKNGDEDNSLHPTLVSSNLVIVPKGQEIDDENINNLNVTISEKRQDYYLYIDNNKNRAMSLFPNVKEVINDENNEEVFKPYYFKENIESKPIEKVKSNLPMKKAIKFSFASLKKKKLRLFFTILLAILSVILTGTAINFTQYSLTTAVASSIKKDNGSYIEASSSFALSNKNYALQSNDLDYLDSLDKTVAYEYNHTFRFICAPSANQALSQDILFKDREMAGLLVCDNIEDYGYDSKKFKVIYEKENISESDYSKGIYISSVVACTIIKYVNDYAPDYKVKFGLYSIKDLIGYEFRVSSNAQSGVLSFPVIGIYDFDENLSMYNKYASLYDNFDVTTSRKYEELSKSILLRMVVKPQFLKTFKDSFSKFKTTCLISSLLGSELAISDIYALSKYQLEAGYEVYFTDSSWNAMNFFDKVEQMKPNQIFIGSKLYLNLVQDKFVFDLDEFKDFAKTYNSQHNTLKIQNSRGSNGEVYQSITDVEIIGVIYKRNTTNEYTTGVYTSNQVFDTLLDNYFKPNKALIKTDENENYVKLIDDLYDNGFTIDNYFVKYFLSFSSTISRFSTLINVVAIIWFVIVTILLYSFISSSIKDNSKQIGILKALGANIKDIYKIYMVEALLIGICSSIFGVLGYYFGGLLVNDIVTSLFYTFYFPIFNCNFITILIMIISTFLILIVSLVIPLSRIKGINPNDVINNSL